MRLINTNTGLLEEFICDDIPEYAILSHTWEKDEISLQEYQRITDPDLVNDPKTLRIKAKAGFVKIRGCIKLAISKEISYVWIDTCCIDKTSSADLSESINSMYRWYANSKVCFAYLIDVKTKDSLWQSRWFTRGWTLQELIAPPVVEFYSHSWDPIGTKASRAINLSYTTGITRAVLEGDYLSYSSVASKMSWASNRTTTRKEDMAYCLLGLFDINMPLLYGEGEKAFLRLQEHIAASSTDHSLFAWGLCDESYMRGCATDLLEEGLQTYRNLFASSPADFRHCEMAAEIKIVESDTWMQINRGLHAILPTIPAAKARQLCTPEGTLPGYIDDKDYLVILNCENRCTVCIWVSLIDFRDDGKHGFCRVTDRLAGPYSWQILDVLNSSPDKFRMDL
jgi:hypothetical protein